MKKEFKIIADLIEKKDLVWFKYMLASAYSTDIQFQKAHDIFIELENDFFEIENYTMTYNVKTLLLTRIY